MHKPRWRRDAFSGCSMAQRHKEPGKAKRVVSGLEKRHNKYVHYNGDDIIVILMVIIIYNGD